MEAAPAPPRLAPWRATLALAALCALGLGVLLGVQRAPKRVTVDVLDLLPADQRDPAIALARQAAVGRPGRAMLFALSDAKAPQKAPVVAAQKFAAALGAQPKLFDAAFSGFDAAARERLTKFFFDQRLALRLPAWFEAKSRAWAADGKSGPPEVDWMAEKTAAELQEFLATPEALAMSELIPRDPLLLLPTFLADLADLAGSGLATGGGSADSGLTATGPNGVNYALVHAQIAASPLEEKGQDPVFAAVRAAFEKVRAEAGPETDLKIWTGGTNVLASDTRHRVEGEMTFLTNLSLGGMLLLLLYAFRHPLAYVHLLLPILTAITWAWAICLAVFGNVHLLSVIFSTIMVGVAVDYGILTLGYGEPGKTSLREALQRNRLTLTMGCLTGVSGFLFMLTNELPLLRQMGLSVALGLIFSLLIYFVYLPWMPALRLPKASAAATSFHPGRRLWVGALVVALASAALLAVAQPRWGDNIRSWQQENAKLLEDQRSLRALFGRSTDDTVALSIAEDQKSALARLEALNLLCAQRRSGNERYLNLARVLPSPGQASAARAWFASQPKFVERLKAAFEEAGFEGESFAPFFADLEKFLTSASVPDPVTLLPALRQVLPLPLQNLWSDEGARPAFFATALSKSLFEKIIPAERTQVGVTPLDQTPTLNAALSRYRDAAFRLAGFGLLTLNLIVVCIYGLRRGGFMILLPAVSAMFGAAMLGFLGRDLGLLQVVGLLLGICLSSDYSIFLGSPGSLPTNARRSIRLSACTTLLSFGVLLFSSNPALQSLCLTVTLVVGCALVLCEASQRLSD